MIIVIRCPRCNRYLGKADGAAAMIEIPCPKCAGIGVYKTSGWLRIERVVLTPNETRRIIATTSG